LEQIARTFPKARQAKGHFKLTTMKFHRAAMISRELIDRANFKLTTIKFHRLASYTIAAIG
jgi:hypothetical protein